MILQIFDCRITSPNLHSRLVNQRMFVFMYIYIQWANVRKVVLFFNSMRMRIYYLIQRVLSLLNLIWKKIWRVKCIILIRSSRRTFEGRPLGPPKFSTCQSVGQLSRASNEHHRTLLLTDREESRPKTHTGAYCAASVSFSRG